MLRTVDRLLILAGGLLVMAISLVFAASYGPKTAAQLEARAELALRGANAGPIRASFMSRTGWPSRHANLSQGEGQTEITRERAAKAVAAVPGVGGVFWSDGTMNAESGTADLSPLHCQDDVAALLNARSIRFEESSSEIDKASVLLLDEVANALKPCTGAVIAIIGHTDQSGSERVNVALSQDRADAVRRALLADGIPADGLRAEGVGSREPVEGLDPSDPANRRIEFSVIAKQPLVPTPVDTPAAR